MEGPSNQQRLCHHVKLGAHQLYCHHAQSASTIHFTYYCWQPTTSRMSGDGTSLFIAPWQVHVVGLSHKLGVRVFLFQQLGTQVGNLMSLIFIWMAVPSTVICSLLAAAYVYLVLVSKATHIHWTVSNVKQLEDALVGDRNALVTSCSLGDIMLRCDSVLMA